MPRGPETRGPDSPDLGKQAGLLPSTASSIVSSTWPGFSTRNRRAGRKPVRSRRFLMERPGLFCGHNGR
jgi:hypothetical protein